MVFGITSEEEARLAHIEVETLQAAISEANDWVFFTDITLSLKHII